MGYEISTVTEIQPENRLVPAIVQRQENSAKYAVSSFKSRISSAISSSTNFLYSYKYNDKSLLGTDITKLCTYICQVENQVDNRSLTGYSSICMEGKFICGEILGNQDLYSEHTQNLINKNQLKNKKIDISLPVENSIIKLATISKMDNAEIRRAIRYGSLWKGLMRQEDSSDSYSIFYQVIRREEFSETMDILLVATKLEHINIYSDLVNKSDVAPVIIDAKNAALDSSLKNHPLQNYKQGTVLIELGFERSYIMVMGESHPHVFDMELSQTEINSILGYDSGNSLIVDSIIRRYKTRIEAIIDVYRKTRRLMVIEDIYVSSSFPLINNFIEKLRASLTSCNVMECNMVDYVSINDNFGINNTSGIIANICKSIMPARKRHEEWVEIRKSNADGIQYFHHYKPITFDLPIKIGNFNPQITYRIQSESTLARIACYPHYFAVAASIIAAFIMFKSYCDLSAINKQLSGSSAIHNIEKQYYAKTVELETLQDTISQMDNISETGIEIAKNNNQQYVLSIYNYLDSVLQQGVWLKQMNFTAPNNVEIEGRSLEDSSALSFLATMNSSKAFYKVSLKHMQSINERDIYSQETIPLKSFLFTGKVSKEISEYTPNIR